MRRWIRWKTKYYIRLIKIKSKRCNREKCRCIICWKASTVNLPKGVTMNTDNHRLGELLYMGFFFLPIHMYSSGGIYKSSKVWTFCTPGKGPPFATVNCLLE